MFKPTKKQMKSNKSAPVTVNIIELTQPIPIIKVALFNTYEVMKPLRNSFITDILHAIQVNLGEVRHEFGVLLDALENTHTGFTLNEEGMADMTSALPFPGHNQTTYLKGSDSPDDIIIKETNDEDGYVIYSISIVNIDTTQHWRINRTPYLETYEYYEPPVIINEDLNYSQW